MPRLIDFKSLINPKTLSWILLHLFSLSGFLWVLGPGFISDFYSHDRVRTTWAVICLGAALSATFGAGLSPALFERFAVLRKQPAVEEIKVTETITAKT